MRYIFQSAAVGIALILGMCQVSAQSRDSLRSESRQEAAVEPPMSKAVAPLADGEIGEGTTHDYAIGPGDVLAIQVWKNPDLSRTMPVRPDGKISMPVLGDLQAGGLTALELQNTIAGKLRDYVKSPEVNVTIEQIRSRTFNVVGKVTKAGSFDLIKRTSVLDALALAGGFQEYAHVTKIYVLRQSGSGTRAILPFNYKKVIRGEHFEQNVDLQPGDTVVVP